MTLNDYAKQLAGYCASGPGAVPRYVFRTRVERILYGMLASLCQAQVGVRPAGLHQSQLQAVLPRTAGRAARPSEVLAWEIVDAFETFTYLSDSSNRSNDGQDLRLDQCRDRFLRICNAIETVAG